MSDPFSFTLLAGHMYEIGAVCDDFADSTGTQFSPDVTQHGITSSGSMNGNVMGYDNPVIVQPGRAMIPLQLFDATTPEPSSLALCGIAGAIGLGLARIRRGRAIA